MRKSHKYMDLKYYLLKLIVISCVAGFLILGQVNKAKEQNLLDEQLSINNAELEVILPDQQQVSEAGEMLESTTFSKQNETEGNIDHKVNNILRNMTLEEKVGQLLVIGFSNKHIDNHVKEMVEEYKVGGIIYYDRNMETPKQVAELSNDLQQLALRTDKQIPLLISIDQEGGQIVRMKNHVAPIPSQQELGKDGDTKRVYETALRNGRELKAMGIHINFAPVLDLSTTDSRSFGIDPKKTSELGKQAIKGFRAAGITAAIKHFPGNGRSHIDPHDETSSVEANQLDLENNDIYPFKKVIDDLDHQTFFTMVTHIKYPAYDKENPASISQIIIQDLLRKELGYNGIVVTDDLEMGAVNKYYTYQDLGFRAIRSGADLLLVCHTLKNQREVINGLKEAVLTGELPEERVNEAVKRILSYKFKQIPSTKNNGL